MCVLVKTKARLYCRKKKSQDSEQLTRTELICCSQCNQIRVAWPPPSNSDAKWNTVAWRNSKGSKDREDQWFEKSFLGSTYITSAHIPVARTQLNGLHPSAKMETLSLPMCSRRENKQINNTVDKLLALSLQKYMCMCAQERGAGLSIATCL